MTERKIIINNNHSETRVAVLEDDNVSELFIERNRDRGLVGNIYLGTVSRVLPGMQAAFINIGLERTAFLYAGDVYDPEFVKEAPDDSEKLTPEALRERSSSERRPIEKVIREGQRIVVQVAKEPLGSKGARVTMFLSLPGRYLVLMPDFCHIGISRRIEEEDERTRLSDLIAQIKEEGVGIIIRTAAKDISSGHLQKDYKYLQKLWRTIDGKKKQAKPPSLLYQELSLLTKTTRDLYTDEVEQIVVDNEQAYDELTHFLSATIPGAAQKLELYNDKTPIFDVYGIEVDIGRALGHRIELPSGGYLIIDQTEALTSFDINTGRFVGQLSAQETILRTNLESINKVVEQLRIRNIGGIIVIDFIDMEATSDREMVYNALQEALAADKARTNVLRISELGLVQMTRKRTSESLERQLMEPCPYCDGRGRIRSTATEAYDLMREIQRHHVQTNEKRLTVKVREDIREWIMNQEAELFESLVTKFKLKVKFEDSAMRLGVLHEAPYEVKTN